jgi:hypothetical protein
MSIARKTYTLAIRDLFDPRVISAGAEALVKHGATVAGNIASDAAGKIAGDQVKQWVDRLRGHFTDESQELTVALRTANDQAWKTLEIALAGPTLWDGTWFAAVKTSQTDRSLVGSIRDCLDASIGDQGYCKACLKDLRHAREAGVIDAFEKFSLVELVDDANPFARFDDPEAILEAENALVDSIAAEFRSRRYENLAKLLAIKPKNGQSLLALAAQHHFNSALSKNEGLKHKLHFARLDRIDTRLQQGFTFLAELEAEHGAKLDEALASLEGIASAVTETREDVQQLLQLMQQFSRSKLLEPTRYTAEYSFTICNDQEKKVLAEIKRLYRSLTSDARHENPELMIRMALLDMVDGNHSEALREAVASIEYQPDDVARGQRPFHGLSGRTRSQRLPRGT